VKSEMVLEPASMKSTWEGVGLMMAHWPAPREMRVIRRDGFVAEEDGC